MGYQETETVDAIALTDYKDKPMEAYYLGSKEVRTKFGDQTMHEFQKADGTKISVWGFAALNKLLDATPKGIMTKVTYTGKSTTPNQYGNHSHICTVFFDTDMKLEGYQSEPEADDENNSLPF